MWITQQLTALENVIDETPTWTLLNLCKTATTLTLRLDFGQSLTHANMDIIKHGRLSLFTLLLWIKSVIDGNDVTQTSILWKEQGKEATMSCSHTKDAGYSYMYWYRQLPGETMKLIVFTRHGKEEHDFGDSDKVKFSATKPEIYNGTFTVKELEARDNGLYFCAVSQHSDTDALDS
ncbi:uncharacterized protein LOC115566055 [Scomber scombrus]|uniref:Uncharacterized protein LOC115566055 n=1 Tax=Scomber scombrus TaxID=13677 RepID=A0AAV1QJ11_SCOSC